MADRSSGYVDNWQSGKSLPQCNLHMLEAEDSCDVRFLVGPNETRISAHRCVLISRSCVFHAKLCGPLAEKDDVKLPDISDKVFKSFLKFLYTDDTELTPNNVTGLLYLAKKYAVGCLESQCLTYLETSLSGENACTILEQAHGFDEKTLFAKALEVATEHGDISLCSPSFSDLCHGCMKSVVSSENLAVQAKEVFNAVVLWAETECKRQGRGTTPDMKRLVLGDSIFDISFPTMDMKDFVQIVVPTQILTHDEHTKIFSYFACPELDVSPFKVTEVRSKGLVLFYASQKDGAGVSPGEVVIVSCSNDITVKSILLYGAETQETNTCTLYLWKVRARREIVHISESLNVWKSGSGGNIISNLSATFTSYRAGHGTHVVDLGTPIRLTRNTEYGFQVVMKDSHVFTTVGNVFRTPIKAGSTTLNVRTHTGTHGVIAGLVLVD